MESALKSSRQLLQFLKEIEQYGNLDASRTIALKQDIKSIEDLITMIEAAGPQKQIEEIWLRVNELKHYFGGYVGDETGRLLRRSFERLWHDVLDIYSNSKKK